MLRFRAPLARLAGSLLACPPGLARRCLLAPPLRRLSAAASSLPPVALPVDTVFDFKTVESQWQRVWGVHQPSCYSSVLAEPTKFDAAPPVPEPGPGEYLPAVSGQTDDMSSRPAFHSLPMFPYPSGSLHMGHVRVYSMSDTLARYHSLRGFRVMHPMGWDAFGLPAENAAIERGVSPEEWTYSNIKAMRSQLKSLGFKFDWDREVATCHPDYYRWTQWLFLQLHSAGLAYRTNAVVNWDPIDNTVLANEQVDAAGRSWRSGAVVERRPLEQWFFKLTALADELADGVDGLHGWPGAVRVLQKQWIGRRNHARVVFPLAESVVSSLGVTRQPSAKEESATEDQDLVVTVTSSAAPAAAEGEEGEVEDATTSSEEVLDLVNGLEAFTTRPETLFGVTYVALAPAGPVAAAIVARAVAKGIEGAGQAAQFCQGWAARDAAIEQDCRRTEGMLLPWLSVTHPLTGAPLPVFLADYARPGKGTGVVMGVPAHDANDHAFAKEHGVATVEVVVDPAVTADADAKKKKKQQKSKKGETPTPAPEAEAEVPEPEPYTGRAGVLVNSAQFTGMDTEAAAHAISRALAETSPRPLGRPTPTFHVRDWLVSRQRFWGTPIPIIHCQSTSGTNCGPVPVPEADLPVTLPRGLPLTGRGPSPLASDHPAAREWRENVTCPCCGGPGRRETDTLDTFIDSSWYFLRYLCPPAERTQHAWSPSEASSLFPVTQYVGGVEHAILHLLYARFLTRFLHKEGRVSDPEPFAALLTQGMVHGESFRHPETGRFTPRARVVKAKDPATGEEVAFGFATEQEATAVAAGTESPSAAEAEAAGGERLEIVWEKMSKSKHNGVDPVAIVNRFGADVARLFILFKAPPEKVLDWDERTVMGTLRWVNRLWVLVSALEKAAAARGAAGLTPMSAEAKRVYTTLATATGDAYEGVDEWRARAEAAGAPSDATPGLLALPASAVTTAAGEGAVSAAEVAVLNACAAAAAGVTKSLDSRHFNVAISHLMTLSNEISSFLAPSTAPPANPGEASQAVYDPVRLSSPVVGEAACLLFQLLSPLAPHFAAEAYARTKRAVHGLPSPSMTTDGEDPSLAPLPADSAAAAAAAGLSFFDCHAQPWPISTPPPAGTAPAAVAAWETLPKAATAGTLGGWRRLDAVCVVQVNGKKLAAISVAGGLLEPPSDVDAASEWFADAVKSDSDFLTQLADALRTGSKSLCAAAAPNGVPAVGVKVESWDQLGVVAKKVVAKVTRPGHTAMVSIVV